MPSRRGERSAGGWTSGTGYVASHCHLFGVLWGLGATRGLEPTKQGSIREERTPQVSPSRGISLTPFLPATRAFLPQSQQPRGAGPRQGGGGRQLPRCLRARVCQRLERHSRAAWQKGELPEDLELVDKNSAFRNAATQSSRSLASGCVAVIFRGAVTKSHKPETRIGVSQGKAVQPLAGVLPASSGSQPAVPCLVAPTLSSPPSPLLHMSSCVL